VVASLNCTLADLYDPLTMPPDLRAAHEANDRAVLAAYGLTPGTPEPEIVAKTGDLNSHRRHLGGEMIGAAHRAAHHTGTTGILPVAVGYLTRIMKPVKRLIRSPSASE